jgi:molybdopterin synthase catalytic subunit
MIPGRPVSGCLVTVQTTVGPFDVPAAYAAFRAREEHHTGTTVMHHGTVKVPGKKVPSFRYVRFEALAADPEAGLDGIARTAAARFTLHQVYIEHRLGEAMPGGDILLVIVSAATRGPAFDACAWIVEEIKREAVIRLKEIGLVKCSPKLPCGGCRVCRN